MAQPGAVAVQQFDSHTLMARLRWNVRGLEPFPLGDAAANAHETTHRVRRCMGESIGASASPAFSCCVVCSASVPGVSPVLDANGFHMCMQTLRLFRQPDLTQLLGIRTRHGHHHSSCERQGARVLLSGWLIVLHGLQALDVQRSTASNQLARNTPAGRPGQLPIPLCVQTVFRIAFQQPVGLACYGHGYYIGRQIGQDVMLVFVGSKNLSTSPHLRATRSFRMHGFVIVMYTLPQFGAQQLITFGSLHDRSFTTCTIAMVSQTKAHPHHVFDHARSPLTTGRGDKPILRVIGHVSSAITGTHIGQSFTLLLFLIHALQVAADNRRIGSPVLRWDAALALSKTGCLCNT